MFAYIKGELVDVSTDSIVIDMGNYGVNVRVSERFLEELPPIGTQMKVHTYTYVKEDAFLLYGFASKTDLELFKMMITVSGIGPKGALAILSVMSGNDLRFAIYAGDAKAISKANGVGAKTAERMILELRDKINIEDTLTAPLEDSVESISGTGDLNASKKDAIEALVALGYNMTEATKAVKQVDVALTDADDILKAALKYLF